MSLPTVPPTSGKVLAGNGSEYNLMYPPGFLLGLDAGGAGTPLNTTSETSILNSAISNAIPAFVAVGDAVQLRVWGTAIFGGTGTITFNIYAGSTQIVNMGTGGSYAVGVRRGWMMDVWIELLSATTVAVSGFAWPRGPSGASFNGLTAATDTQIGGNDTGNPITVTTLPQNLDVKAITSISTATTQVSCQGARVRYYPKNY